MLPPGVGDKGLLALYVSGFGFGFGGLGFRVWVSGVEIRFRVS